MGDELSPPGSVQVACQYPGCGWSTWKDPLDPTLLAGPYLCETDHEAQSVADRFFAGLRLRTGIEMRQYGPDLRSGQAEFLNPHMGERGVLGWDSLSALCRKTEADILWDKHMDGGLPESDRVIPTGHVWWSGYQINGGPSRRYTAVQCARPGCPYQLYVDLDRPSTRLVWTDSWEMGGTFGSGTAPRPRWMDNRELRCEDGISTSCWHPCRLAYDGTLEALMRRTGVRWTRWEVRGEHSGVVLLHYPATGNYGVLAYPDESVFADTGLLWAAIRWGTLAMARDRIAQSWPACRMLTDMDLILNAPS